MGQDFFAHHAWGIPIRNESLSRLMWEVAHCAEEQVPFTLEHLDEHVAAVVGAGLVKQSDLEEIVAWFERGEFGLEGPTHVVFRKAIAEDLGLKPKDIPPDAVFLHVEDEDEHPGDSAVEPMTVIVGFGMFGITPHEKHKVPAAFAEKAHHYSWVTC